jgi:hypothetical protein
MEPIALIRMFHPPTRDNWWKMRCKDWHELVAVARRATRRRSADPSERSLAQWAANQRCQFWKGLRPMTVSRTCVTSTLSPGATSGDENGTHELVAATETGRSGVVRIVMGRGSV